MEKFNSLPNIFYLGFYHPLYNYYEDCYEDNEYFNEYSQKILELKNSVHEAIRFFTKELDRIIDDEEVVITAVPSSDATCTSSGIVDLSKQLLQCKRNFIDGTSCIKRVKSIPKQSQSSEKRTKKRHKDSIEIQNQSIIKDRRVIILDDVLTTGNTVKACQELLIETGAKEVKIIVLGKTIRYLENVCDLVEETYEQYIAELGYMYYGYHQKVEMEKIINLEDCNIYFQEKHQEIDEWANDEHEELECFYSGYDEGHYYIDQEAEEKHYLIMQEDYECTGSIEAEAEKEHSMLEYDEGLAEEHYIDSKCQVYEAINGYSCLSPSNPFIKLLLN